MECICGHWNRFEVNKIFLEQPSPEPKVKVMIPMYEPLETSKSRVSVNKVTNHMLPMTKSYLDPNRGARLALRTHKICLII
jgi:hypothetical protein